MKTSMTLLVLAMAARPAAAQSTTDTVLSQTAIDTVAPKSAEESPFSFRTGALELAGTLTLPANYSHPIPVVLIVAGSGPTDRNGNSAGALRAQNNSNLYAILAWQLAEAGIASVRYDKRILGENLKKLHVDSLSIDDFVDDALAGARALAGNKRFSKVILLGHSEGAGLVLQAANRGAPVAGVIMMSGAGRPIMTVIREQLSRQLPPEELVKWDSASARYLRGEPVGDVLPGLMSLLQPANRRFMQTWAKYDPTAEIARVKVPVLIVQGGKDIQVSEADARALAAAQPSATLLLIPSANHVYRAATTSDLRSQMKLYTDPTIPVVPELASGIVGWVRKL
jgi:pimeloyl-ACP methyl ester carboxylesterase